MLERTIRSARAQQGVRVRIIVVDDASSDETPGWLAKQDDLNVITVRPGRGCGGARNLGIGDVDAPWVAFCDDDDIWAPDKLRAQLDAIAVTPGARWACCGAVHVDDRLRPFAAHRPPAHGPVLPLLQDQNVIPGGGSGVLADVGLVRSVGAFDESLPEWEDWDLWRRLAATGDPAIVDRPLLAYRVQPGSMTFWADEHPDVFDADPAAPSDRRTAHQRNLARNDARSGRRVPAARGFLRLAITERNVADAVRAAASLAGPRAFLVVGQQLGRRSIPASWRAELGWLAKYESSDTSH
jgi:glycosyltransferase involved in cell wall biosynthesis